MKLLKIILIAIVFTGSVFPCIETENISLNEKSIINIPAGLQEETEDNCISCCFCTCCSVSFSFESIIPFQSFIISDNIILCIQHNYLFSHYQPIWQPPKIS
ncbi:MAG: hypothetical protein Q7S39_00090 [Ignavibacteria bacterium]|nr:hypothetical protein [Ignavibacteria bacterium]